MPLLSAADVQHRLNDLDGWRLEEKQIVKQFTFAGFPEAVAFVSRLVPGAEAADHHPDITIQLQARHARVLDTQRGRPDR